MSLRLLPVLALLAGCFHHAGIPDDALRHNDQGVRLLREGRLDEAEAHLELALEYRPRFAEARVNLGVVHLSRGEIDEAEACFRRAIADDPDLPVARANLGVVLERRGLFQDALAAYRAALAIDPATYQARFNLARLLVLEGEAHEARRELLRLHVQHPDDAAILGALAVVEWKLDELERARERVEAAGRLEESHPLVHFARGLLLAHTGDLDPAIEAFELARRDPGLEDAALARIAALHRLAGRPDAADDAARALPEGSLVRALSIAPRPF